MCVCVFIKTVLYLLPKGVVSLGTWVVHMQYRCRGARATTHMGCGLSSAGCRTRDWHLTGRRGVGRRRDRETGSAGSRRRYRPYTVTFSLLGEWRRRKREARAHTRARSRYTYEHTTSARARNSRVRPLTFTGRWVVRTRGLRTGPCSVCGYLLSKRGNSSTTLSHHRRRRREKCWWGTGGGGGVMRLQVVRYEFSQCHNQRQKRPRCGSNFDFLFFRSFFIKIIAHINSARIGK